MDLGDSSLTNIWHICWRSFFIFFGIVNSIWGLFARILWVSIRTPIAIFQSLQSHQIYNCHAIEADYHSKALHAYGELIDYQARLWDRSLYAYVHVYNRLPQALVDLPSVKSFQSKLTHLAKHRAQTNQEGWRRSYQDCSEIWDMFYANT